MADSAAMKDPHDRLCEYAYVETKGLLAQVLLLERDLHGYGQFVPPVDLGPPRDPRQQTVDVLARAQVDQVVLVEQRRSRPDDAHLPHDHAEKLRQFVQAEPAEETADRCDPRFGPVE